MDTFVMKLQTLIDNMEHIRDTQRSPNENILALLDQLYALQIKLESNAINVQTDGYKSATLAIQDAVSLSQQAIKDLSKLGSILSHVSTIVGKVADLIA